MRKTVLATLVLGLFATHCARSAQADDGGQVHNLKVLSNQVDDVTTVEQILKSFTKPGMSDQERSKGLWTSILKYRHQSAPPNEYLAADWEAHDPVKIFNVYGYCMCCCTSALFEALSRADGREARGRILNGHSVAETRYDDAWHMFDGSLMTFFPKPGSGVAASVDEISSAVDGWLKQHPDYRKNGGKLVDFMRQDGWTGYKKGPELLAECPYYKLGYLPARTHGWDATMVEYDRKCEVYEYGYQVGHRAVFSLRPGESIVREAGHRDLHVNMNEAPDWDGLRSRAPENDLVYVNDLVPGYRGGIVGNGVQRYAPDLSTNELALGAERYENLAVDKQGLCVKDPSHPGVAVIAMSSPYVYLRGKLKIKVLGHGSLAKTVISLSTNNGRSFAPFGSGETDGVYEAASDLSGKILRRYAYWLKLEMTTDAANRARIESIVVENDFQHAPRTLPRLAQGRNTITVAADPDPTLATRTISCRITPPDSTFDKNETTTTLGVVFDNLRVDDGSCWWQGGVGTMTVPIDVPGDLAALRFSTQIRARSEKDLIKVLVSTDEGNTWRETARIAGPTPGTTRVFRHNDWPGGVRKLLLRFEMTGNNTVGIMSFRIDADYQDPRAGSKPKPFHVVHRWLEAGRERTHDELIDRLPKSYAIEARAEPELVSVSYGKRER